MFSGVGRGDGGGGGRGDGGRALCTGYYVRREHDEQDTQNYGKNNRVKDKILVLGSVANDKVENLENKSKRAPMDIFLSAGDQ